MTTPVRLTPQALDDVSQFVPDDEQDALILLIAERLGLYPEFGGELEEPDDWARSARFDPYRVSYELIVGPPQRIRVLRVVPIPFGKVPLEP